jgi:hypothetical protein
MVVKEEVANQRKQHIHTSHNVALNRENLVAFLALNWIDAAWLNVR